MTIIKKISFYVVGLPTKPYHLDIATEINVISFAKIKIILMTLEFLSSEKCKSKILITEIMIVMETIRVPNVNINSIENDNVTV